MKTTKHPVEVLTFRSGDNLATIATDGTRHVTQELELVREFDKLSRAISYLCSKGYSIDTENFRSL